MHEREIFKYIQNSPKLLQGPDLLRTLSKVWSAYTKLVRSLLNQNKTAICPELGKLMATCQGAVFQASPSFLSISSLPAKPIPQSSSNPEQVLSYSTISSASGYNKETCMNCIKEIISASLLLSKSQEVTLDLKVGRLVLRPNDYTFITCSLPSVPSIPNSAREKRSDRTGNRENLMQKPDSAHPANPNDIGHFNSTGKRIKSVPPKPNFIPFPYLPGFYEENDDKLGKRYNFQETLSPEELFKEHKKQIAIKKFKKEFQANQGKQEGIVLANVANNQMAKDREIRENKEKALKELFVKANKSQIETHRARREEDLTEKKNEKYDFFPFVYGSKLEEFKGKIKLQLQEEMKEKMRNDKKEFSSKRDLSESYITSFPIFLKQDKFEPKRRTFDNHVKETMGQALNRYEKELINLKIQNENEMNKKELENKLTYMIVQQNKSRRDDKLRENKNYLLQQMEDKVRKK